MRVRLGWSILAAFLLVAFMSTRAFAQGSFFTSLSGTVVDFSGAVIPGADVKIKNNGTGAEFNDRDRQRRRLHHDRRCQAAPIRSRCR